MAQRFELSVRTVQRLFARFAQHGQQAIAPDYNACGQQQPQRTPKPTIRELCQIRRCHPRWGSEMIRLELAESTDTLPSARTIRRHLHQAGLQGATAGRKAASSPLVPRACQPHQGWQIDACEDLRLRTGKRVSWLRVVDECSGAFLQTVVFPHARWEHVGRHEVQAALRQTFCTWGLPQRIRVDNGYPWGNSGDFPPELALWLLGLGIQMVWIDPCCPRQNAVVERSQDIGQDWFEPQKCRSVAELQRCADAMDRRQRQEYPYRDGRSRLEVYPQLDHSGRVYRASQESRMWTVSSVYAVLAQRVVSRQVDCSGSISVYHRSRFVGKMHVGKRVYVYMDPSGPTWVIADQAGRQLRTHAAEELSAQRIRSLDVAYRKPSRQ